MKTPVQRPEPSDGPWSIGENTVGDTAIVDASGLMLVAVITKRWHTANEREWAHNANLIAAAPELLAALKALRKNVDTDLSGWWTESTSNFVQQADAAIAKAEGRQMGAVTSHQTARS